MFVHQLHTHIYIYIHGHKPSPIALARERRSLINKRLAESGGLTSALQHAKSALESLDAREAEVCSAWNTLSHTCGGEPRRSHLFLSDCVYERDTRVLMHKPSRFPCLCMLCQAETELQQTTQECKRVEMLLDKVSSRILERKAELYRSPIQKRSI